MDEERSLSTFYRTGHQERLLLHAGELRAGMPVAIPGRGAALALLRDLGRTLSGHLTLRRLYAEVRGGASSFGASDEAMLDDLAHRLSVGQLRVTTLPLPVPVIPAGAVLAAPPPSEPADKPAEEAKKPKAWIEIHLEDNSDPPQPMPGAMYRIELPDGNVIEGYLDDTGHARVEGIDPGNCKVTFPEVDGGIWQ
jgi:hypothetical protein